jgi:hypothetical protein
LTITAGGRTPRQAILLLAAFALSAADVIVSGMGGTPSILLTLKLSYSLRITQIGKYYASTERTVQMLILLGLLLVLLFFGLGFTLHALWVVAVILFMAWLLGEGKARDETVFIGGSLPFERDHLGHTGPCPSLPYRKATPLVKPYSKVPPEGTGEGASPGAL